jgi:EmrB/QacA subfamily drug resistance transporter
MTSAVVKQTSDVTLGSRNRWLALIVLCVGVLPIMVDVTVVNVVLSPIREDLRFTDNSLVWVINAYTLVFGGFLLLGGRLGDLYGHRKLFLIGVALFTIGSLACGLSSTKTLLIGSRALQGFAGAIVTAIALSLVMNIFTDRVERAKAMGVYGFVCAGGGSIGLLLGGTVASALNWHWIFLINVPIGLVVYALCVSLLPKVRQEKVQGRVDVGGATTVTASLMLATFAIVNGNEYGWASARTLDLLACSMALVVVFVIIETVVSVPLVPLGIFRLRNFAISNIVGALWLAGGTTWLYMSALYMQVLLGYGPMRVGLASMPANAMCAIFALGVSAKLVTRFGIKMPLSTGLLLVTISLALFSRVPLDGKVITAVLPSMILLGVGAGIAFNPLMLAAVSDVAPSEYGVASGIVNTSCVMGGALGLAILASLAAARSSDLIALGSNTHAALAGGYRLALMVSVVCVGTGAVLSAAFLRENRQVTAHLPRASREAGFN